MQEIVRLREVALTGKGETNITVEPIDIGDHYTYARPAYISIAARVLRVYSYVGGAQGIESKSVKDITGRCKILQADAKGVRVSIPSTAADRGRTACVLAAFTLLTPDVFAPHLVEFERNILQQYADVALAGAAKDEWGFPGRGEPRTDDLYFSRSMADVYAKRRPGRDLTRDLLLMSKGEKGRESQRAAAINHYMEMNWQRNGELEAAYYDSIKKIFGKEAMSATHPTWYAYPNALEAFKNGLDWWVAKRDLAQTDEAAPFCARTAMAKKWHSPLWYNMYFDPNIKSYEEDIWRHALGGGRINFHPRCPDFPIEKMSTSLLYDKLYAADCRVRLLNYISTAMIDCPVAVIFGHPSALNWSGKGFADVGLAVTNGLWAEGFYADLIPSSEITAGNLKIADDGSIQYGPQRYAAAVFYHPEYERPAVAKFFGKVAGDKTALFRVGDWTEDFESKALRSTVALPPEMKPLDTTAAVQQVIAHLKSLGIEPQTRCTMRGAAGFPASMMPKPSGQCRLLDGTVILASGEKDVMGDPIQKSVQVRGHEVSFDAVGVAAVRLDKDGKLEAMAAGALKSFHGGGLSIELPEPVDVALWRDAKGQWHGIVQGWTGPIPAPLSAITADWQRLTVPTPLTN
jgi:hypothetical protein